MDKVAVAIGAIAAIASVVGVTVRAEEPVAVRELRLLVPSSVTVSHVGGDSFSGQLAGFGEEGATLATGDARKTIPLSEIQELELSGDIWIANPSGERVRTPYRAGEPRTIYGLPLAALRLEGDPPETATLDLATMSDRGFDRLSRRIDLEQWHPLVGIAIESDGTMTVEVDAELKAK